MNRADPDCGTSFTWVTRAMGPRIGWLTDWAIIVAVAFSVVPVLELAKMLLRRNVSEDGP